MKKTSLLFGCILFQDAYILTSPNLYSAAANVYHNELLSKSHLPDSVPYSAYPYGRLCEAAYDELGGEHCVARKGICCLTSASLRTRLLHHIKSHIASLGNCWSLRVRVRH